MPLIISIRAVIISEWIDLHNAGTICHNRKFELKLSSFYRTYFMYGTFINNHICHYTWWYSIINQMTIFVSLFLKFSFKNVILVPFFLLWCLFVIGIFCKLNFSCWIQNKYINFLLLIIFSICFKYILCTVYLLLYFY